MKGVVFFPVWKAGKVADSLEVLLLLLRLLRLWLGRTVDEGLRSLARY